MHARMKTTVLLCLAILTLSDIISADENCFAINPGSSADVCSWLLDKLQLALIRNPTNIYLIKKAWSEPVPSLVHVAYEVDISNKSDVACITNGNITEPANTSIAFGDALWTDRGIFALIHPGILQQIQLQLPYLIIQFASLFVGTGNPFGSFVLSAIQWNGCKSSTVQGLPNITLSLQVDYLPCTPSSLQLETSLLELTAWLLAFDNLQPQNRLPDLDIERRKFALSSDFTVRSSLVTLKYLALPAYFCIFLGICLGVRKLLYRLFKQAQVADEKACKQAQTDLEKACKQAKEKAREKAHEYLRGMFTSVLLVVGTWNILILIADIVSFVQCPPTTDNAQIFNLILFSITCLMWPILLVIVSVFKKRKPEMVKKEFKYIARILQFYSRENSKRDHELVSEFVYVIALWNIFMFAAYFSTSAVAASLLVYAYPFEVLSMAAFLIVSFIFNVVLFAIIVRAAFTLLKTSKNYNPENDPETNNFENGSETNNPENDPETNNSENGSETNNPENDPEANNSENGSETKYLDDFKTWHECKELLFFFSVVMLIFLVSLLMNIVLLATFGIAILRGLVGIDGTVGRIITLLPSIVLALISYLLKHFFTSTTDEKTGNDQTTQTTPPNGPPSTNQPRNVENDRVIENPVFNPSDSP